jgi:hypothetical protein
MLLRGVVERAVIAELSLLHGGRALPAHDRAC